MPGPFPNQLSSNPWVINVPSDSVLFDGAMPHVQIEYIDYSDANHHVEIQNRDGRVVAYLKGTPDLRTVRTGRIGWVYGVKVPPNDSDGQLNMASGRIILYYE